MPSIRSRQSDTHANALVAAAEAGQLEELHQLLAKGDPDAQTVVCRCALLQRPTVVQPPT